MEAVYLLVILASCIFGSNFLLDNQYQRRVGSGIMSSLGHTLVGGTAGLIGLLIVNFFMNGMQFSLAFHPAALVIAAFAAANGIIYTFCSLRAMSVINLSLYSVFAMLGGMALPSVLGMIIIDPSTGAREPFTLAKAVCFVCIIAALLLTVKKGKGSNEGKIYYIGVFVLNGMSGVLATLVKKFTYTSDATLMDAISSGYSVITAVMSLVAAGIAFLILLRKHKSTVTPLAAGFAALGGALNKIANFILVISLTLGAASSIQYPLVTGVVMIVSTLLCYVTPKKPTRRDIASVAFAFAGVVAIMAIPI